MKKVNIVILGSPNDADRFEQISLLENWLQLGEQLKVCEELLETVQQNAL